MEAACERLCAVQDVQMQLIEKNSSLLTDQIAYWNAVRHENMLLYAARKKGVTCIGHCRVPHLAVCAERAKQAIEMHLALQELQKTQWGRDTWSLTDTSWENYMSEPTRSLKKGARVIEVEYDGNASNRNWYTVYNLLYMRTEDGWFFATGGADGNGLFYTTMSGERTYYDFFSRDAARFSATGAYIVRDSDRVYSACSSTSSDSRDGIDGLWVSQEGPEGDPAGKEAIPAQSVSPLYGTTCGSAVRGSVGRIRAGVRSHPYCVPLSQGLPQCRITSSSVSSTLSLDLERGEEEQETQQQEQPDSTETLDEPARPRATPTFNLLHPTGPQICALVAGNANQVKCYRYRIKKSHRRRYKNCTTTWWTVADQGAERQGEAQLLITFDTSEQRSDFLKSVPLPTGMNIRGFTATVDF
ncbi:E2 [Bos taurus papillomavirus 14]|uniref:Regulatory protein E2 n=1 Tax=Bos taurus papillomavirus 14 TaxID=2758381 RepID=A0A0E3X4M0_BPV1|nr:E2 [Bos taurus papillomavirus 14]ALL29333.1 E2 [Bos taurus papillomavirus 14]